VWKRRTKGCDTFVMLSLVLPVGEVHLSNHVDQAEQLKIENISIFGIRCNWFLISLISKLNKLYCRTIIINQEVTRICRLS
jgi:hypothetical protein